MKEICLHTDNGETNIHSLVDGSYVFYPEGKDAPKPLAVSPTFVKGRPKFASTKIEQKQTIHPDDRIVFRNVIYKPYAIKTDDTKNRYWVRIGRTTR